MPTLLTLPAEILHQIFSHLIPHQKFHRSAHLDRRHHVALRTLCMVCTGPAKRVAEELYWKNFLLGKNQVKEGYYAKLFSLEDLSHRPTLAVNIRHFRHARHNAPLKQTIEAFEQDAVQSFINDTYAEPFCTFIRHMFGNATKDGEKAEEHGMCLAVVLVLTLAVNVETVTLEMMDRWPTAITKLFAFSGAQFDNKGANQDSGQEGNEKPYLTQQGKIRAPLSNLHSIILPSPGNHYTYWTDYVSSSYIAPFLNFPGLRSFSTRCIKWDIMVDRSKGWEEAKDWVVPMPWNDERYGAISAKNRFFLQAHESWPALKHLRLEHAESRDIDWSTRMMWPERKRLQLERVVEDGERVGTRPRTLRLDNILPRFPNLESLTILPHFQHWGAHDWHLYGHALRRHSSRLKSLELCLDLSSAERYSFGTIGSLRGHLEQLTHLSSPLIRHTGHGIVDGVRTSGTVNPADYLPSSLEYFYTMTTTEDWEIRGLRQMFESCAEKLPHLTWIWVDAHYPDARVRKVEDLASEICGFHVQRFGISSFLFWKNGSQPRTLFDISPDWHRCWEGREATRRWSMGIRD